jgi:hypothetical protein
MKRWVLLLWLMFILPSAALGETLGEGIGQLIGTLELEKLDRAAAECALFQSDARTILRKLAGGELVLSAQDALTYVLTQAAGVFRRSLWRMTRLMVPMLVVSCAEWIRSEHESSAKAARYTGMILTMALLISDLREHVALAGETVDRMAEWMQAIFPVLVTLLAAVGGTASSAFYQPAVIVAALVITPNSLPSTKASTMPNASKVLIRLSPLTLAVSITSSVGSSPLRSHRSTAPKASWAFSMPLPSISPKVTVLPAALPMV